MPQNQTLATEPESTWSLAEQIEELRGKLHLKERDSKAFYESSEAKKIQYEKLICKLRSENKEMRVKLARSINGDEKVIRSVFQNRREELLSMQRCTVAEAIETMDQKVCESSKRLNTLQYVRSEREDRLDELQNTLQRMRKIDMYDIDFERKRDIRRLQNEMDKACIKFEAARNISRRYEEIMKHMAEECRTYPAKLDHLEETVKEAKDELMVLRQMNEKAVRSSEEQRKDLHTMERDMYQAKRARDMQLNETKKEVDRRKEPNERVEKRAKVNLIADTTDIKAAKLLMEKTERQEKILTLDEGFEKIKSAIKVSEIGDVVFRIINQKSTRERIIQQKREKFAILKRLMGEKEKHIKIFEEMKFTSQRQFAKGRKAIEEMETFVKGEEKLCKEVVKNMTRDEKLLLDLQSGIVTLYEKLKEVKLRPPYHNYSKGDPVDDLSNCARKLDVLVSELGIKDGMVKISKTLDHHKLHAYLESRLPAENVRIKVEADDGSDVDEFHFDHDQDNEGLLSREDIKKQGQDLLNSKLKPKKKKGRKSRNK